MAILSVTLPLTGGGDMSGDVAVAIQQADGTQPGYLSIVDWNKFNSKVGSVSDASETVKGVLLLSTDPDDPVNPIAWGVNDDNVEMTANKVSAFMSPTDTQYPSALLVSNSLAGKINKQPAIAAGTATKVTYNVDGVIVAGDFATTADIGEVVDKRYVTDNQQIALNGLSGINTGDQNLSAYALQSSLDTTNANVTALSASLSDYALTSDLAATNATVAGISSSLSGYATTSSLAATQSELDALETNVSNNYTPLTTFNTLNDSFNSLTSSLLDPSFIGSSTAAEVKLTFSAGLTRNVNNITNDLVTASIVTNTFWGNITGATGVAGWTTIAAANLSNGVTGTGKVVLDTLPTIQLDVSNLVGQFGSSVAVKTTTTDQTNITEMAHFSVPIVAGSVVGTTWRIVAWGNIDNGANVTQFLQSLHWGGIGGVVLIATPIITSPATAQTNKPWRTEVYVIITSVGATGTARAMISATEYTSAAGLTGQSSNSGATDVINVNTTINTTMVLTWVMSTATGSPHVRTFGAIAELVRK